MTYQFNIQLKGITKPPVWRRVLVPDTYDFLDKFSRQKTIDASKTKPYWRKIPTARKHRISLTGWEREKGEHGIPLVSTWKKPKPA